MTKTRDASRQAASPHGSDEVARGPTLRASARSTPEGRTLAAALQESHVAHGDAGDHGDIALNWVIGKKSRIYWHNGGTGGFNAYAEFDPAKDRGVVVLANLGPGDFQLADTLAEHITERLNGQPAIALSPPR